MAEIYPLGENRVFYKAAIRTEGGQPDIVTAVLLDPDLNSNEDIILNPVQPVGMEIIPGLFYFDVDFSKEGTYIAIFYEDGVEKTTQAFSTRRLPTVSEEQVGFRSFLGENVIGTS